MGTLVTAAAKADDPPNVVGKAQLCAILGWSRDRLDRALHGDPNFPVVARDPKPTFDVEVVRAYVERIERESASKITPRGRRENAQAQKIEDELRASRGELVEVAPMKAAIETALTVWANHDDSASDTIASRLGLDETQAAVVRDVLDDRRRSLEKALRAALGDDDDDDDGTGDDD